MYNHAQVHAVRSQASQPLCHNLQQVRHDLAFEVVLYAVVKIKYILKPLILIHLSITYSSGTDQGEKTILTYICFCFLLFLFFLFF